jgi:CubicO group peptidase (beta-lactamase class C family)
LDFRAHSAQGETMQRIFPKPALPQVARRAPALLAAFLLIAPLGWSQRQASATKTAPKPLPAETAGKSSPTPAGGAHELTASDVEAFLDGFMPQQLATENKAGAVIAIVKDGKLLFEKGYGYSDVEKKSPISPQDTLFRPGSISKLFTWTSVMQLVEQGKLDLDRDVNDYLDYKLPANFGKPTTLRDIMTHRPGLQETIKDLFLNSDKKLTPIAQYLPAHIPAQIFPPGTIPAYSNYATTVAGYVVQRVSGQPFDDYVDQHIFQPLNMTRATFRQPLPPNLAQFMSKGYQLASDPAKDFEYVEVAPAGSLSASAESMTHFMIAHLQNGKYGDAQILKPETAIQMHARQKGWPDTMNAMCLGFYEESQNGHRIIGHGGDTEYFHSDLHLILDENVGFFVSYNSAGHSEGEGGRTTLFSAFMDRYFPAPPANQPTLATAADDAKQVAGLYRVSRGFETNFLSVLTVLGEAKIDVDPKDHTLVLPDFKNEAGKPKHFREIGPLLFQDVDGKGKIQFVKDSDGHLQAYIDFPFMAFLKIESLADKNMFNYVVACFGLGMMVLTLLLWPVAAVLRKHYGVPLSLDSRARRMRLILRLVCVLFLAFVIWFAVALSGLQKLQGPSDGVLHLIQIIALLGVIGAIYAILAAVISWTDQKQWVWHRVWNVLLALGLVGFSWFLIHWHLLNFNLNY